ncbi:SDR family NAD(P)-dependent oxidoreductase [Paenarthrobacter sp. NPDC089714]|uniref:SDR family NAD(P)-dependent oxidoreductase n=1 Tax=Paenarthrobacter sp. NPDC089714 TaxID=3364377 RepID=UPI0037F465E7
MTSLDGQIVLVTGAAGGIGSAVARTIVAGGGDVILHDVNAEAVEALANELGRAATTLTANLADAKETERLWADALAIHGRIDVLVNNAGIYPPAPIDAHLEDWVAVWDLSLAVNLKAPAVLCKEAVTTYSEQDKGGIIINLASRAAFRGEDPDYWHYAAAKAGVVAMTRTIARQNGRHGVTAFAIAPGYVDTSLNHVFRDTVGISAAAAMTGLGEVAQPQDIANVIAFLATGLAKHATGTTIDINGASYVR